LAWVIWDDERGQILVEFPDGVLAESAQDYFVAPGLLDDGGRAPFSRRTAGFIPAIPRIETHYDLCLISSRTVWKEKFQLQRPPT
jgi:hypothetical protein